MTGERLLVVVAHPDDETFGCGSVIAWAAARGAEVRVVSATAGEAGEVAPGVEVPSGGLAAHREAELRAAAAHLGAGSVEVLGYGDSGMAGPPPPGSLVAAPLEEVAARIRDAIDAFRPSVVLTLDAADGHRDHAHVRDATVLAAEQAASRPARVYLQCLARSLMRRWVEHARSMQPGREHLELDTDALGTPDDEITTVLDTAHLEPRRLEAIRLHASQASPFEGLPPDLRRDFLTVDRLRRVVPPWDGGPVEHDVFG